jgi:hypothetical protein
MKVNHKALALAQQGLELPLTHQTFLMHSVSLTLALTPYISDRLTCEYCQEVDFRLSYIGTPIVAEINTNKTAIRPNGPGQRLMSGGLVYGGERVLVTPDQTDYALSVIKDIGQGGGICLNAPF